MDVTKPAEYDSNDRFHVLLRDIYTKKRDGQTRNATRRAVRDDSAALDDDEAVDKPSKTSPKRAARPKTAVRSASATSKRAVRSTQTRSAARKATSTATAAMKSSPRSQRTQSSPREENDDGAMELDDTSSVHDDGDTSSDSNAEFSPPSAMNTRASTRGRSRGRARRAAAPPTTISTTTHGTDTAMDTNAGRGPTMGTFSPRTSHSRPRRQPTFTRKPSLTFNANAKANVNPSGTDGAAENEADEHGSSTDEEPMISVPTAYFKQLQRETLWRRDAMRKAGMEGEDEGNGGAEGMGKGGLDFVRD